MADPHIKKIALLGFDREGRSVLRFLADDPEFRGADIWILDKKEDIELPAGANVRSQLGARYLDDLDRFDVIFRTAGARYHMPELQAAIAHGVTVSSATKLFFERCPGTIIGVTGTKGKGTTSTLIYEILKRGGKKAFIAGNIGRPAVDILPEMDRDSWAVLELSSFQLIDLETSPHIGVALMVTSEHLDWHTDVEEYAAAKANVVRFQSPDDFAVLAEDYPRSAAYADLTAGSVFTFSRRHPVKKGTWVEGGAFRFAGDDGTNGGATETICPVDTLHIPGEHNWENAGAAITVGKIAGISNGDIAAAIDDFRGLEHRLEFVAEKGGVRWYDDSYSTMPDAAEVALAAFDEPKIMILGGSSKGADFSSLAEAIRGSKSVKAIIGVGAEWPRIKEAILAANNTPAPSSLPPSILLLEGCTDMEAIVRAARGAAAPGDVVILSPACASFGMFKNYTERGDQFKAEVRRLT
ncbi:MAG: UDP-N-acetylmuramoyl-L-alanine--D-glutamate ligase [Candidatus Pacebacteria bacterium]|nr:UDP-N-acetylmuramoyl-L-alanine--D-glutamate ligase [Candidatus Paceibacterota bacterium]